MKKAQCPFRLTEGPIPLQRAEDRFRIGHTRKASRKPVATARLAAAEKPPAGHHRLHGLSVPKTYATWADVLHLAVGSVPRLVPGQAVEMHEAFWNGLLDVRWEDAPLGQRPLGWS